jgi:hypothetical protein
MHQRRLRTTFGMAVLLAAASIIAPLSAQTTNGTLVGTVTDAQHAVVPQATVTVKNTGTGIERQVPTDNSGNYSVYPLQAGSYDISASAAGFQAKTVSNVVLEVAASVKVDFELAVGNIAESVSVAANAAMLQTQDASVGGTITGTQIDALPVNGRNYTSLVLLLPGTSDENKNARRGSEAGSNTYAVNGQRGQDNNYTIDGVDSNFLMGNSPGASPSMDAIQEFRILNNMSAEYGRSAGSNVNIVIKSGSRDLHGTAYEYIRNDAVDAATFFGNLESQPKSPYRQNQYGVSVGGPLVIPKIYHGRDKTFWFFAWEGYRERQGQTQINTSPTQAERNGNFSGLSNTLYDPLTGTLITSGPNAGSINRQPFQGNIIPASRINPGIAFLVNAMMPMPNLPGSSNNYVNNQALANNRDQFDGRMDHYFSTKDSVFFRYIHQDVGQVTPEAYPTEIGEDRYDVRNIAAGWNHIFNSTTVLEVKFGYNFPANPLYTVNPTLSRADFITKTGITMFEPTIAGGNLPNFNNGDFSIGPSVGEGGFSDTHDHITQYSADFSKILGKHSIKFGGQYSDRHFYQNTGNPQNGIAVFDNGITSLYSNNNSGDGYASMELGYPSNITRALGDTLLQGRQHIANFFVQDDWRVSGRLTINAGLRYEPQPTPYDANNQLGNLWIRRNPQTGQYYGTLMWAGINPQVDPNTGQANEAAQTYGFGRGLQRNNYMDFAPRFGFAYQLNQKTVIRSAYGWFFNSTFFQELQDRRKFWPYNVQQVFSPNTGTLPDLSITDPGPSYGSTASIGGWPQNPENRTPYSQQWNLTIQRQLMSDLTLDVAYVGSHNVHQLGYDPINDATSPGPGPVDPRRLIPSLGDLDGGSNDFNSNYNALQVKAVKRYSKGLQVDGSYTWSRCMDTDDSLNEYNMQDMYNLKGEYGRCSLDIRQLFQGDFVYDLPFGKGRRFGSNWNRAVDGLAGGWTMQSILRFNTGPPINVQSGEDRANVGRSYQRPNVVSNPCASVPGDQSPQEWFAPGSIVRANIYTYGNMGRDSGCGAGLENIDFAVHKIFPITERQRLEFRGEFFNLLNHTNLDPQNHNGPGDMVYLSTSFNTVTAARANRQIQFSLRFAF